ncbi:hypothetical protein A3850_011250 [Lewinella sp. 4G2]|nr:hypothetical protein A3850_011250 [Lewinella sp. 4G2]
MDEATSLGLDAALDRLFESIALPANPTYVDYVRPDGEAGIGDEWMNLAVSEFDASADRSARARSVQAWWFQSTAEAGFNIREKMVLFWHNHFGMGGINADRERVRFLNTYRDYATGNFKELVKLMTIDVYMLRFLDGHVSTRQNPNENYARELLELFTIGKGPQVAPGDYTNYTEQDVTELARALTGWRTINFNTISPGLDSYAEYVTNRHDRTDKTLSYRFDNQVITNNEENEYLDVVDIIFTKDEVARYLCRKLYRHFVYYDVTDEVETNIIAPMSQLVIDNQYDIAPALRALLSCEHFYETSIIGGMIKTPLDLVQSTFRVANFYEQDTVQNGQQAARRGFIHARDTGMDLLTPPSVAGWTAYYQEPSFHRIWLNTSTIQARTSHARRCTTGAFYWDQTAYRCDWLSVVDGLNNPYDSISVVEEMCSILLPKPLEQEQTDALVELLLGGQEDFVWTNEYSDYQANPNDMAGIDAVTSRIRSMMYGLMQLAEFHVH